MAIIYSMSGSSRGSEPVVAVHSGIMKQCTALTFPLSWFSAPQRKGYITSDKLTDKTPLHQICRPLLHGQTSCQAALPNGCMRTCSETASQDETVLLWTILGFRQYQCRQERAYSLLFEDLTEHRQFQVYRHRH